MIDETENKDLSPSSPTTDPAEYWAKVIEEAEKEAFMCGFNMADNDAMISPEDAYEEWTEGR